MHQSPTQAYSSAYGQILRHLQLLVPNRLQLPLLQLAAAGATQKLPSAAPKAAASAPPAPAASVTAKPSPVMAPRPAVQQASVDSILAIAAMIGVLGVGVFVWFLI